MFCSTFTISCKLGVKIPKSEKARLSTGFSTTLQNQAMQTTSNFRSNFIENFPISIDSISQISEVQLKIVNKSEMLISFKEKDNIREFTILGNLVSGKYFEIYFERKKLQIPPLIPIIRGNTSINRLRIGKDRNGNIIVDHYKNYTGNFLILAAGHKSRHNSIYRSVINN